jgi:hypothetical protein
MADEANQPAPADVAEATNPQPDAPAETQDTGSEPEGLEKLAKAASDAADETEEEDKGAEEPEKGADEEEPDQPDASDEEGEEAEKGKPDPQAAKNSFQERARLRSDVAQTLDSIAKPQTTEDLVAQGVDPALAEVEALKQDLNRKEVINYVADLNASLNSDASNLMRDYPVFKADSPEYDEQFDKEVEGLYKRMGGFKTDPSGRFVIQAAPLYDFYAAFAKARGSGAKAGVVKGQKAAEKMLAAADTPSSGSPQAASGSTDENPFLKGLKGGATK